MTSKKRDDTVRKSDAVKKFYGDLASALARFLAREHTRKAEKAAEKKIRKAVQQKANKGRLSTRPKRGRPK